MVAALLALAASHSVEAANGYYNGLKLPFAAGLTRVVVRSTGHGPGRHAVDFGMSYEDVLAMYAGRVVAVGTDRPTGGKLIIIDHGDNYCSLYLHLDRFYVSYGQYVQQGERIALSGNTGQSTGPHLHAAVYRKSGGECGAAGAGNEVAMLFDEHPRGELRAGEWVTSANGRPAAPYYPSVDNVRSTSMLVKWNDYSNNEQGFKIERSGDKRTWLEVATVEANTIKWLNDGLSPSTQYCYRVRSFNGVGPSAYSNVVCATTAPPDASQTIAADTASPSESDELIAADDALGAAPPSVDMPPASNAATILDDAESAVRALLAAIGLAGPSSANP